MGAHREDRKPARGLLLLGLAVSTAAATAAGAGPATPTARTPQFPSSTERVLVDFVVRDKQGALLRDLAADEVVVYEDGRPQRVLSLERAEVGAPVAARDASGQITPIPARALVAFVFDRLSPAARSLAKRTVLAHLDKSPARTISGVFAIDRGLDTVHAFTEDKDALRRSLGRYLTPATAYTGVRERTIVRTAYAGLGSGFGQAHVAAAELAGAPECRAREDDVVRRLEILDARLIEAYDSLERAEQGRATTHALLALVSGLSTLPGRKAVVLFSEGLVVPAEVEAGLRAVMAAANRASVSVYTVETGGLRATSASDETRRTIDSLRSRLMLDTMPDNPGVRSSSTQQPPVSNLSLLERNEDALRMAPTSGLGQLADQTGGFLIRDTNDLGPGLAQIDEELHSYYLVSYAPTNPRYDGRFRSITLKVRRPHGRLQARKGYLALRADLPTPALEHEAPALALLAEGGPLPVKVPVRLSTLQFPEEASLPVVPVVVDVPARSFAFARDGKAGVFRQDFTIVALLKDEGGRVVWKASQRYPRAGPLDALEAARKDTIRFYREARLAPGRYRLEAAAQDGLSGALGGARSSFEIPVAAEGRLRASSLMLVSRAEPHSVDRPAPEPLRYGDVVLHPNLGEPIRRHADGTLTFFVTAWPALEHPGVEAQVEVSRGGLTVAKASLAHLQPDADGRIRLASSLPLGSLAPGDYELRVTLSDGRTAETRTAAVPIAP